MLLSDITDLKGHKKMRAISLHPYYALEVLAENKTIECRTWDTKHRGNLLICSTAVNDAGLISGYALAVVNLVDVVPFTTEHLEQACMDELPEKPSFAWIFGDTYAIKPFKVKGKQRLFTVEDKMIEYLPEDITEAEASAIYAPIINK